MITCSADIHEIQRILLLIQQTNDSRSHATTGFWRALPVSLLAMVVMLSGCELLRDEPTNLALKTIETYANMTDTEFVAQSRPLAIRERGSLTYLRALREQGSKLGYRVDSVARDNPAHRGVVVIVNERNRAGIKQERARYRVELSRNKKKTWQVTSFQLIE